MRVTEAFPSNYLKAADLQDRNVSVVIDRCEMETVGTDRKIVLYFKGKEKGLVLNKTNANNIAMVYGDDTDEWSGGDLVLYPAMVDYQGRSVPAIRVRVPPRRPRASANGASAQGRVTVTSGRLAPAHQDERDYAPVETGAGAPLDDDIPFSPEMRG